MNEKIKFHFGLKMKFIFEKRKKERKGKVEGIEREEEDYLRRI